MKILTILFLSYFLLTGCKQKNENFNIQNSLKTSSKLQNKNKEDTRDSYTLKFENGDTLKVVSNFFPLKPIDSFSQQNKNIRGKYFYCFKGGISPKISKVLKSNFDINTAHSIIIKVDTVFFNGRKKINCLKENDSILIESTIYTFYQNKKETNLLIIDDFIKIK